MAGDQERGPKGELTSNWRQVGNKTDKNLAALTAGRYWNGKLIVLADQEKKHVMNEKNSPLTLKDRVVRKETDRLSAPELSKKESPIEPSNKRVNPLMSNDPDIVSSIEQHRHLYQPVEEPISFWKEHEEKQVAPRNIVPFRKKKGEIIKSSAIEEEFLNPSRRSQVFGREHENQPVALPSGGAHVKKHWLQNKDVPERSNYERQVQEAILLGSRRGILDKNGNVQNRYLYWMQIQLLRLLEWPRDEATLEGSTDDYDKQCVEAILDGIRRGILDKNGNVQRKYLYRVPLPRDTEGREVSWGTIIANAGKHRTLEEVKEMLQDGRKRYRQRYPNNVPPREDDLFPFEDE
jgi:hypothetical protein